MRTQIAAILMTAFAATAFADDAPLPSPVAQTKAKAAEVKPRPTAGPRARPARKRVTAAEVARAQAQLDAEIQRQGMQVMQAESDRQAAIQAEQYRQQYQQAQQLETIRRLTPPSTTITRVRPNGSYETNTYYVSPNQYPLIPYLQP